MLIWLKYPLQSTPNHRSNLHSIKVSASRVCSETEHSQWSTLVFSGGCAA